MKKYTRIIVVAMMLSLLVPFAGVMAQDGDVPAPDIFEAGLFLQNAASGSFAETEGGYALTLEDVSAETLWLIAAPSLGVYRIETSALVENWVANEDLVADAVLEVEGLNIVMVVGMPVLDEMDGSLTYAVTVSSIIPLEESKDEPEVPEAFDAATLSIAWSPEFQDGIWVGVENRYEGMRITDQECADANTAWKDYQTWRAQTSSTINQKKITCNGWDGTTDPDVKAAACAEATTLTAQMAQRQVEMNPVAYRVYVECR